MEQDIFSSKTGTHHHGHVHHRTPSRVRALA